LLKPNSTAIKFLDTTKGVITRDLYESGHIDSPSCPDHGETIKLLIVITSAPPHRDMRLAIRQTWGHFSTRRDIKIVFLVGTSNDDEKVHQTTFVDFTSKRYNSTIQLKIAAENFMYNDIIRGKFVGMYAYFLKKIASKSIFFVSIISSKRFIQ
jgi:hypothetical protein